MPQLSLRSLRQFIADNTQPVYGYVRISYAHLITHVSASDRNVDTQMAIAVKHAKSAKRGETKWQAMGGGAHLTPNGVEMLRTAFAATDFEADEKNDSVDARFIVPGPALVPATEYLITAGASDIELFPDREFIEEVNEYGELFTDEELQQFSYECLGIAIQPTVESEDSSTRSRDAKAPSRRIFMSWLATAPEILISRLLEAEHIRQFSKAELALTNGGRLKAELPDDGGIVANNIGVPISFKV